MILCITRIYNLGINLFLSTSYLTLQEEEHQHADEISIGAAPASALSQSFFCLWIMSTEQP